jgi:hypothetical protein
MKTMAGWLTQAGYDEIAPVPVGRRPARASTAARNRPYSPNDFRSERLHFSNFQKAICEHEIVA